MKRKIYLPLTIVLAIGLIVLVLVLNKKATMIIDIPSKE